MAYSEETQHEEEHIHMPSPSWSPIILALGMAILLFSVIWKDTVGGLIGILLGTIITVLGLGWWVLEEIRNANAPVQH
jgi:hypothetical protein